MSQVRLFEYYSLGTMSGFALRKDSQPSVFRLVERRVVSKIIMVLFFVR